MITQSELAKKLGISRQMVWAYEKNRSVPSFGIAQKLMQLALEHGIAIKAESFFIHRNGG